ncbi:DUF3846 domain-containing protein [Mammaliicoccus lentus]|uniref:DUF3846 domain-containing protein n=1 Tax=Mammaliicoccus lentus TaxID=42858 RepID=UPI0010716588|nr:hypothetical protein [Mammaliicoccus lentus]MBF0793340.1 hypothetical protein [Mammaliicoccus lentus]TFV17841.1 hypothetical protein E4T78_01650 [Mammaliicoccus lentus]
MYLKFDDNNKKLVDVSKNKKESNLEFLRRELDCDLVSVETIGYLDIWVDNEGLLTNNYENIHTLSIHDEEEIVEQITIAGSFVFASYNDEGETLPLSNSDKKYIRDNIKITSETPQEYVNRTNGNEYNDEF